MSDRSRELDTALRAVAGRIAFPETPRIAEPVGARLRAHAARRHPPPFARLAAWPRGRLVVVLAIAFVLVAGAAVAARLAIGGFAIEVVPSLTPSAAPEAPRAFGREVSLAEAVRETGIQPGWPPGLGPPDDVYVVRADALGPVVVMGWRGTPAAASIQDTPWRAVLFELHDDTDIATKYVGANVIHPAFVNGRRAFWISGAHDLTLGGAAGQRALRVSGNVLIWERTPGLVYRLETMLSKADAIALAETLR
jgi:hypothetical protein